MCVDKNLTNLALAASTNAVSLAKGLDSVAIFHNVNPCFTCVVDDCVLAKEKPLSLVAVLSVDCFVLIIVLFLLIVDID